MTPVFYLGDSLRMIAPMLRIVLLVAAGLALASCASDDQAADPARSTDVEQAGQRFPDVIGVQVDRTGETFAFAVTISSPYDRPERYADGWRIVGPDGTVHAEHTLAHDHANEQPFTRTQSGVEIPPDVSEVTVEGRDRQHGYGGGAKTVTLP